MHDEGIDDGPDIVDGPVAHNLDASGLRIDLKLADVGAIAERKARRVVGSLAGKPWFYGIERKIVRDVRGLRDRLQWHLPVGARDEKNAIGKFDVANRGFEKVGGDQFALGDDLVCRARDRRAADGDGARAEGTGAIGDQIGVALDHFDLLHRNAKPRRQDLRQRGYMPLTVIMRAERGTNPAIRLDPHSGGFVKARTRTERSRKTRRRNA